jgi:hypothetical protein
MAEPSEASAYCKRKDAFVVVYIVASIDGGLDVVYGRVKPGLMECPVATFMKRFARAEAKHAIKTIVDFATKVDKVPIFQINPEVVRFAGLCDEYPLLCEDPVVIIKRLSTGIAERRGGGERSQPRPSNQTWLLDELVRVLREKLELDPDFAEVIKRVVENPDKLRECYV